jgi:hypothetical protein
MCFSPAADLVGGVAITAVGLDALRHVRQRAEIPIAALPLVLGFHQLIETPVWWGLQGHVSTDVESMATWIYLLIAFVVLPIGVPIAIRAVEPTPARRALMVPFIVLGAAVAVTLLRSMISEPVSAALGTRHIAYDIGVPYGAFIVTAYVIATCGSLLISGHRYIVIFGAINLPVIALLALAAPSGFASLWCAWAAVTSVMIAAHLRRRPEEERPAVRVSLGAGR